MSRRILLTCGLGDFIAIESYLTHEERAAVTAVHYATRAHLSLQDLVAFVFPNLHAQIIERDTWGAPFTAGFCIGSRAELPDLDPAVEDWSIARFADEILAGSRIYRGSTFAQRQLCTLDHIMLPATPFFVLHPFSANARTIDRDLNFDEWVATLRFLRRRRFAAVLVNQGGEKMPAHPDVLDLSDRLTLFEALEVTKRAAGFIGCSSVFSVLASKVLPEGAIFVKGNHIMKARFHWLYYAPQSSNKFIAAGDLRKVLPRV